jgi:hypothetical protein
LYGDGEAERAGFRLRKRLDRCAKIDNPNRLEGLLALVSSCRLGFDFSGTSSQGFSATKHQGVFSAKKKVSGSEPDLRKKNVSDQRIHVSKTPQKSDKSFFFWYFFLFFPED